MFRFASGAVSHVRLVRDHNEDAGFAGPYLQLVADGVGGAAAGEVASATTAYVVSALAAIRPTTDPVRLLVDAVAESHRQLRRGVADDPARAGMATTLTAVLARHDRLTVVHVGDSRAYLLRDGRLRRLTSDDTVVQALAQGGRDNVTCLVADVVDGPRVCPDGRQLGAMCDPYLVVDPAAVRGELTA